MAPSDCRGRGPALSLSAAVLLGRGSAAVLGPRALPSLLLSALMSVLARVVGGFPSPPRPNPNPPRCSVALGVHFSNFVPPGQCVHSRGVDSLRRLDSPSHSLAVPPGVFRHYVGLTASSVSPHSEGIDCHSVDLAALPSTSHSIEIALRVFLPVDDPLPRRGSHPMAAYRSCLTGGHRGGVASVAPAGRCAPMFTVRAVFF